MMDGMKMAGMIRYFYDHKGFGPSGCTGRDGGRLLCEMEHGLSNGVWTERGRLLSTILGILAILRVCFKE